MLRRKPPPKMNYIRINGFVCYRRKRLSQDTYFKTSNSKCVLVTEIGASFIVLGQDITGVVILIAHVSYRNSLKPL